MSQPVFTPFIIISEEENFLDLQRVTKLHKQQVVLKKTSPHHPGFPFHPTPNCLKKSSWRQEIRVASFWTWLSSSSSWDMATWRGQTFGSLGAKKTRLLHQYHSHEAMYRKDHSKYKGETWELNDPICLSQNCFLTHYLLSISININAKIIPFCMIGSSIVSTSIHSESNDIF